MLLEWRHRKREKHFKQYILTDEQTHFLCLIVCLSSIQSSKLKRKKLKMKCKKNFSLCKLSSTETVLKPIENQILILMITAFYSFYHWLMFATALRWETFSFNNLQPKKALPVTKILITIYVRFPNFLFIWSFFFINMIFQAIRIATWVVYSIDIVSNLKIQWMTSLINNKLIRRFVTLNHLDLSYENETDIYDIWAYLLRSFFSYL